LTLLTNLLVFLAFKQGLVKSFNPGPEKVGLSKEHPATWAYLGKASGVLHLLKGRLDETAFLCLPSKVG
jgi:hypothetical protein